MGSPTEMTEGAMPPPDLGEKFVNLVEDHSANTSMSETTDGCIILGKDAGRGNKYVTRCRIDRSKQRHHLTESILEEECCPCMTSESRESCKRFVSAILTSEPLMLTLHLGAVIIMTVKESLDLRSVDEDLHLTASIIETYVAAHLIVTRMAAAWEGFKALRGDRVSLEYVDGDSGLRMPRLRRVLIGFTIFGCILLGGALTAFIMFYFLAHLGWTILTNNFCIIVMTALSGILTARIDAELEGIKQDQHKAIICETVMLLSESANAVDGEERQKLNEKIERFCKSLRDTVMFERPDYITVPQTQLNLITQLQFQSLV